MMLLQVQGLTKTFGGLRALDDVSLSVEEGTIHGLMGANGAGKTTLFSLIAGNQAPTAGEHPVSGSAHRWPVTGSHLPSGDRAHVSDRSALCGAERAAKC